MSKWPSIIALSSAAMRVLAGTSFGAALGIGAQTALSPNPANVLSAGTLGLGVLATIAAIFFLLLDQIYKFLLDIILAINF